MFVYRAEDVRWNASRSFWMAFTFKIDTFELYGYNYWCALGDFWLASLGREVKEDSEKSSVEELSHVRWTFDFASRIFLLEHPSLGFQDAIPNRKKNNATSCLGFLLDSQWNSRRILQIGFCCFDVDHLSSKTSLFDLGTDQDALSLCFNLYKGSCKVLNNYLESKF